MANNTDYGFFIPVKGEPSNIPLQEGQFIINPETGETYTDIEVFANDQDETGEVQRIKLNPTTSTLDSTDDETPVNGQAVANFVNSSVDSIFDGSSSRAVSGSAISDILRTLYVVPPDPINTNSGATNEYILRYGLDDSLTEATFTVRNGEKGEPGGVIISKVYNDTTEMENDSSTVFPDLAFVLVLTKDSNDNYTAADLYLRAYTRETDSFGREFETIGYKLITNLLKDIDPELLVGQRYKVGNNTKGEIFNDYSHNIASGDYSHTEGFYALASGSVSHAEGSYTKATGGVSHAEGLHTTANGDYSHAEGYYTEAIGNSSHAEGSYTIASGQNQHVSGKFNIPDITSAEIIGWGTTTSDRKNIRTLDTSGNEKLSGGLETGGSVEVKSSDITLSNISSEVYSGTGVKIQDSEGNNIGYVKPYTQINSDNYNNIITDTMVGLDIGTERTIDNQPIYNSFHLGIDEEGNKHVWVYAPEAWRTALDAIDGTGAIKALVENASATEIGYGADLNNTTYETQGIYYTASGATVAGSINNRPAGISAPFKLIVFSINNVSKSQLLIPYGKSSLCYCVRNKRKDGNTWENWSDWSYFYSSESLVTKTGESQIAGTLTLSDTQFSAPAPTEKKWHRYQVRWTDISNEPVGYISGIWNNDDFNGGRGLEFTAMRPKQGTTSDYDYNGLTLGIDNSGHQIVGLAKEPWRTAIGTNVWKSRTVSSGNIVLGTNVTQDSGSNITIQYNEAIKLCCADLHLQISRSVVDGEEVLLSGLPKPPSHTVTGILGSSKNDIIRCIIDTNGVVKVAGTSGTTKTLQNSNLWFSGNITYPYNTL